MHENAIYSFGPFALDATQRVLLRGDVPLRLTPKETDVLIALVERHGEIVDKSRLLDQVWRGVCVEECNLSQHIAALRRILGDDAHQPTFIETVPRRGYRFVAPVARVLPATPLAVTPLPGAAHTESPSVTVVPEPPGPPPPAPVLASPRVSSRPLRRSASLALVAALTVIGLGWGSAHVQARAEAPALRSVAVLPFANLTGDAHQDRIAATLSSALLDDLRAATGLRVEQARSPAETGKPVTGVDALVETALLSGEGRVRLAVELIDVKNDRLIWAEMFECDPVSALHTEDRIAQAIVSRLGAIHDGDPVDRSARDREEAHREYALAREYLSRRTPQVVPEALDHFTKASERDPSYALAHVGVADAYLLGAEERVLAPKEALARAETAARRALELEPRLAEAHAALGEIAASRWDFDTAETFYRRALSLDPSIATVHEHYAALLTIQDRHEEAIAEARVARDLSPSCPAAATALAAAYYHAGRNDVAIEQALVALRITPRFPAAYDVLGWAHQGKGDASEAVAAFREAVRLSGRGLTYVAALARAYARAGAKGEARKLLSELERGAKTRAASPLDLAEVLAAVGETDEALKQVERAVAEGTPWLEHVDSGLSLAALHDHGRFRDLVARMRRAAVAEGEKRANVGAVIEASIGRGPGSLPVSAVSSATARSAL